MSLFFMNKDERQNEKRRIRIKMIMIYGKWVKTKKRQVTR